MNFKRFLGLVFLFIFNLNFIYAVDFDNINWTEEIFSTSDVQFVNLVETSTGKLNVVYRRSNVAYLKQCELNGTSCGSEQTIGATNQQNGLDMIEDTTNNKLIVITAPVASGVYYVCDLDGTNCDGGTTFNPAIVRYPTAAEINSTHFVIAYQDGGDSDKGKIIACDLTGGSCGSEVTMTDDVVAISSTFVTSQDNISVSFIDNTNTSLVNIQYDKTLTRVSGEEIDSAATNNVNTFEHNGELKFVYRDNNNHGAFKTCDLDGTNCGSKVVWNNIGVTQHISATLAGDRIFAVFDDVSNPGGRRFTSLNFNVSGGNISDKSDVITSRGERNIDMILTSEGKLVVGYYDVSNVDGVFSISEQLVTPPNVTGIEFINITVNGVAMSNLTFFNVSELDWTTLVNVTDTNANVNQTYNLTKLILGNNSVVQYATNNLSGNFSLNLTDGFYDIDLLAENNETNTTVGFLFIVDTNAPQLNVSLPAEYNAYTGFNFSQYISVNDSVTNITSCIVNVVGHTNTTCSDTNYTFLFNGNVTVNILATDQAGNQVASLGNVILVNPFQRFHFQEGGSPLTNLTFGGRSDVNGTVTYKVFSDGLSLGNNTLLFEKLGYASQSISFTLNSTSDLNETFNVSLARIILRIKDQVSGSLITGSNFSVNFIATVGLETSTTTGIVNVSNTLFLNEEYRIVVSNANYQTESIFFDFTNQEVLELDVFMINSSNPDLGVVFIKAVDRFSSPIEGATIQALQWDSTLSDFVKVSESKTGSDGLGTLNIILNSEIYEFTAEFNTFFALTDDGDGIIDDTENGKTITLVLSVGAGPKTYVFQDLIYQVNESFNNATNISTISVSWQDLNGLPRQICINEYRVLSFTETLVNENCGISDDAGTLLQAYFINNTFRTTLKVEVKEDGEFLKPDLDSFTFAPRDHPSEILQDLGLNIFLMPMLMLLSVAGAIWLENTFVGNLGIAVVGLVSLFMTPTLTTAGIVAFFGFMSWVGVNYGVKPK